MTAAAALALSLITYIQLNSRPEVVISMPRIIKMSAAQYHENTPQTLTFIIGPIFQVYERTDVTPVISDVRLLVDDPTANGGRRQFEWMDNVNFVYNTEARALYPEWESDPGPFVIRQDAPQNPFLRFQVSEWDWLRAGKSRFTLMAERLSQEPIEIRFCVDVSDDAVQFLYSQELEPYSSSIPWNFRTGSGFTTTAARDFPECYRA